MAEHGELYVKASDAVVGYSSTGWIPSGEEAHVGCAWEGALEVTFLALHRDVQ